MCVLQLEDDFTVAIRNNFEQYEWKYFQFNEVKKHLHTVFYASVRFIRELLYKVDITKFTSADNTLTLEKLLNLKDNNRITYHQILELDIKNYINILITYEKEDCHICGNDFTQKYFDEEEKFIEVITHTTIQYFKDLDAKVFE